MSLHFPMFQRLVVRSPRHLRSLPTAWSRFLATRGQAIGSVPILLSRPPIVSLSVAAVGSTSAAACAFCSRGSVEKNSSQNKWPRVVLYQYEPCPYCCKVKAVLDYLAIPYKVVEVNPVTKKETKGFTDYAKVPVLRIDDDVVVDSSVIISRLRDLGIGVKNNDPDVRQEEEEWRQWVDHKLIVLTPPNIYRTIPEALQAFEYCLTEGNFTPMERRVSKYVGAVVMYFIAKRSKKKYEIDDERQALYSALDEWVDAIGDHRLFLGGNEPNMADLSVFGVLRAMHGLDTYNDIMRETKIKPWFTRMTTKVGASSRLSSSN